MAYLKIDESLIKSVFTPLSFVAEKVVISIKDSKITTCTTTPDGMIILHLIKQVETDLDDVNFNIVDVKRLKNLLESATDLEDNDQLVLKGNVLQYKSKKWRFKHHLLDDGILKSMQINSKKIKEFGNKTSFTLTKENLKEIVKLKSLNPTCEKVYFKFTKDDGVVAVVTDYVITNSDEMSVEVCKDFDGEENSMGCPVYFEMIKILSQNRNVDEYKVKYNGGAFLIQAVSDGVLLSYIVSEIKN